MNQINRSTIDLTGRVRFQDVTLPENFSNSVTLEVSTPANAIYARIQSGDSLIEAVNNWKASARKALEVYKQHFENCNVHLINPDIDSNDRQAQVVLITASALQAKDADFKELADWLQAASFNGGTAENTEQEKSNMLDYAQTLLENKGKDSALLEDYREENELLFLQLRQLQDEFIKRFGANTKSGNRTQKSKPARTELPKETKPPQAQAVLETLPPSGFLRKRFSRIINYIATHRQVALVKKSVLFDKQWYLTTYKDVKGFKGSPARHYVVHGASEGRDPSPRFSSKRYLSLNPDVAKQSVNPLVHYELFGKKEGRSY